MPRLPHARQFTNRKAMAKKSGYTWHLSAEEFESLAMQPCTDCATTPCRGVYRRDVSTEAPFDVDNCLPLCADCGRRRPKRPRVERKVQVTTTTPMPTNEELLRLLAEARQPTFVLCPVAMNDVLLQALLSQPIPIASQEQIDTISNVDLPESVVDELRCIFNQSSSEQQQEAVFS
jgi:hypothetical protein